MTQLVGILNITPDSFSDGGRFYTPEAALVKARQLFIDGASLVDVGAESTRPSAIPLTPQQEWQRLEPILPTLLDEYTGKISLDTYHPETIHQAFKVGRVMVNDVTGMNNPAMIRVITEHQANCIISHLSGSDIQAAHQGKLVSDISQVVDDLLSSESTLLDAGLDPDQIILDPGIGFGKTSELNWKLLEFAKYLPDHQVKIGYSRKRFLGERRMELDTNLEAAKIAIAAGTAYLRVHDVAGHRQLLTKS